MAKARIAVDRRRSVVLLCDQHTEPSSLINIRGTITGQPGGQK